MIPNYIRNITERLRFENKNRWIFSQFLNLGENCSPYIIFYIIIFIHLPYLIPYLYTKGYSLTTFFILVYISRTFKLINYTSLNYIKCVSKI